MISPKSNLTLNPAVVSTVLETGEAVLMHMDTANYFTLNPTGLRIWQLLEAESTMQQIIEQLVAEYEISAPQAQTSVLTLAQQLVDADLVVVNSTDG